MPKTGYDQKELETEIARLEALPPSPSTALAFGWRCPACGKTAIMRVSVVAVCDGDTIRRVALPRTADSGDPEALVGLA